MPSADVSPRPRCHAGARLASVRTAVGSWSTGRRPGPGWVRPPGVLGRRVSSVRRGSAERRRGSRGSSRAGGIGACCRPACGPRPRPVVHGRGWRRPGPVQPAGIGPGHQLAVVIDEQCHGGRLPSRFRRTPSWACLTSLLTVATCCCWSQPCRGTRLPNGRALVAVIRSAVRDPSCPRRPRSWGSTAPR